MKLFWRLRLPYATRKATEDCKMWLVYLTSVALF
ncbi:hypothetical protein SAMN05444170_6239 [Bradyrhizobium erythrophlei]|jgi:hypothetical protein|uniref:Uncharacterized protein n=1 Tax=Bradyrhizobium erythrophlei TaxID=1437360 RepID=A0A1M7UQR1_9BRAD|nr:hypothetical protein SAMN05444170_6239 [Bradyrhizobium erythrophlei]